MTSGYAYAPILCTGARRRAPTDPADPNIARKLAPLMTTVAVAAAAARAAVGIAARAAVVSIQQLEYRTGFTLLY